MTWKTIRGRRSSGRVSLPSHVLLLYLYLYLGSVNRTVRRILTCYPPFQCRIFTPLSGGTDETPELRLLPYSLQLSLLGTHLIFPKLRMSLTDATLIPALYDSLSNSSPSRRPSIAH